MLSKLSPSPREAEMQRLLQGGLLSNREAGCSLEPPHIGSEYWQPLYKSPAKRLSFLRDHPKENLTWIEVFP